MMYQNFGNGPYRSIFDNQDDASKDLKRSIVSANEDLELNSAERAKKVSGNFLADSDFARTEKGAESH